MTFSVDEEKAMALVYFDVGFRQILNNIFVGELMRWGIAKRTVKWIEN